MVLKKKIFRFLSIGLLLLFGYLSILCVSDTLIERGVDQVVSPGSSLSDLFFLAIIEKYVKIN